MVEIALTIVVTVWFMSLARKSNRNEFIWAVIAVISFYIPVLLSGYFIYPSLVKNVVTEETARQYKIIGFFINVLLGAIGIIIPLTILKRRKSTDN